LTGSGSNNFMLLKTRHIYTKAQIDYPRYLL